MSCRLVKKLCAEGKKKTGGEGEIPQRVGGVDENQVRLWGRKPSVFQPPQSGYVIWSCDKGKRRGERGKNLQVP